ncbi:MAG: DUF4124 domain-containing protein [Betaproteobacteria bacterium]|nr:DUF4124 domain-containing protein [Betaproteobacteria bacterium]
MTAVAHAGVTKWVDADGKVQYSDQPPPVSTKSQKSLNIKTSPALPKATSNSNGESRSIAEKELEFRKRQVKTEEAAAKEAKDQEEAKRAKANCEQSRQQLQALQEGQRMSKYNEKGERVFMEDSDRPQAINEAKQAVDSWCK